MQRRADAGCPPEVIISQTVSCGLLHQSLIVRDGPRRVLDILQAAVPASDMPPVAEPDVVMYLSIYVAMSGGKPGHGPPGQLRPVSVSHLEMGKA
jgi:hypothetical protein